MLVLPIWGKIYQLTYMGGGRKISWSVTLTMIVYIVSQIKSSHFLNFFINHSKCYFFLVNHHNTFVFQSEETVDIFINFVNIINNKKRICLDHTLNVFYLHSYQLNLHILVFPFQNLQILQSPVLLYKLLNH